MFNVNNSHLKHTLHFKRGWTSCVQSAKLPSPSYILFIRGVGVYVVVTARNRCKEMVSCATTITKGTFKATKRH